MSPTKMRLIVVVGALLTFALTLGLGLMGAPPIAAYIVGGIITTVVVLWIVPHVKKR